MVKYTVSQTKISRHWYVHRVDFPDTPLLGSFSKSKRAALDLAARMNNTIDLRKKEDRA